MNYTSKPIIGLVILSLAIFIVFLGVEINHVWKTATTSNTISFNGEGKASAKPDIAMISASVVTQSANAKTAQDQNATKANAVTDFLKKQGVADTDVKTSNYNIYPQYNYSNGQQNITGYQVSQDFQIKVRDLTKVSSILSGLVTAGANQVNNLGLQIDNPDQVMADARQKAIEDAKQKAQEVSGQVGISLGRIVNFSENSGGTPVPLFESAKATDGMGGGPEPIISNGENEVTVNVTLTYEIK